LCDFKSAARCGAAEYKCGAWCVGNMRRRL